MKKLATASLAILATAFIASSAHAEKRWPNWYLGLNAGMNFNPDNDIFTAGGSADIDTDAGYIVGATLGYVPPTEVPFFDMTRWEVEYNYRANDISSVGGVAFDGDFVSHTAMANMLIDFNNSTRWTPWIGGGLGFSEVDFNGDDETSFAWQLKAGLEYAPASMPMTAWGIQYRYLETADSQVSINGVPAEVDYDNHSVEATARFRF